MYIHIYIYVYSHGSLADNMIDQTEENNGLGLKPRIVCPKFQP